MLLYFTIVFHKLIHFWCQYRPLILKVCQQHSLSRLGLSWPQNLPELISGNIKSKLFHGSMLPDPPSGAAYAIWELRPPNLPPPKLLLISLARTLLPSLTLALQPQSQAYPSNRLQNFTWFLLLACMIFYRAYMTLIYQSDCSTSIRCMQLAGIQSYYYTTKKFTQPSHQCSRGHHRLYLLNIN